MYRALPKEEWDRLKGIAPDDDWIPNPDASAVMVGEDQDGVIRCLLVSQLAIHVEPWWISPMRADAQSVDGLWEAMRQHLEGHGVKVFFTHASTPETGTYLESRGLKKLELTPYIGEL